MRVEVIFSSPLSVTYSILTILALELFLDLKLLPSYTWQTKAFDSLPFMIAIANEEGQVSRQTKAAEGIITFKKGYTSHLRPELAEPLLTTPRRQTAHTKLPDQSLSFDITHLTGGFTICAHDTSQLDQQITALQQTTAKLTAQQQTLKAESAVQQKLRSQEEQMALYQEIERALEQSVANINQILSELPADDSPEHHRDRRTDLMLIKLHVAYCKRKGSLLIAATESPYMLKDKMQMVVSETAADLSSIGIDCGALIETTRPLDLQVVNLFYDLFYLFAILSLQLQDPTIMIHLSDSGPDLVTGTGPNHAAGTGPNHAAGNSSARLTGKAPVHEPIQFNMSLIMEGDGMQNLTADPAYADALRNALIGQGISHELATSEDDVRLAVHIPVPNKDVEGGAQHPGTWPQAWPPAPTHPAPNAGPTATSPAPNTKPTATTTAARGGAHD